MDPRTIRQHPIPAQRKQIGAPRYLPSQHDSDLRPSWWPWSTCHLLRRYLASTSRGWPWACAASGPQPQRRRIRFCRI